MFFRKYLEYNYYKKIFLNNLFFKHLKKIDLN